MTRAILIATMVGAAASSADAGILGFSSFARTCTNGNVVVDLFVATQRPSDRLLNVFNVQSPCTFIQQAGTTTRGWKPDAATSTRSNCTDSFLTFGTAGGGAYYGEYYASESTCADGGFSTGWTTFAPTIPQGAGWSYCFPTGPDPLSESILDEAGLRCDSSQAAASAQYGVWIGHFVLPGSTPSCFISLTASVKDGVTGGTASGSATGFEMLCPTPGGVALVALAGFPGRRRRS